MSRPRPARPAGAALLLAAAWLVPGPAAADGWAPGEKLTFVNCGRCHVIGPRNRMGGIGSTPSFAVIRSWPGWEDKMAHFYALNPHPAFTQVPGVTPPFAQEQPTPIHPIELTVEEIGQIVAYARTVAPADLGAPID